MKTKFIPLALIVLLTLLVITLEINTHSVSAATFLYVAPGGNDSHTCLSPGTACATISGAVGKATAGDTVKVAAGTYTGTDVQVVDIDKNVTLSGGWDSGFTTQTSTSTIDGQNARDGIRVETGILASVDRFIIENGTTLGGVGIYNYGTVTVTYTTIQNNPCGSGAVNYGTMTIIGSTIQHNVNHCGTGGGIYSYSSGTLTVIGSTVTDNVDGGIYVQGSQVSIINSTIISNTTGGNGGGIYILAGAGTVDTINNSTISLNRAKTQWGGGIYFENGYGGVLTLNNTIVAMNISGGSGPDCLGVIGSGGYNLISDTTDCTFSSAAGDQLNVDPKLGPLQDNGGPTLTQWLYAGSPAIDGGNPAGCTDVQGSLLTTDQRGYTRPLDGDQDGNNICDIGAYEADPAHLPPPPATALWYVTPSGNDQNDCHTPTTPCATINAAISKASPGDTIYVSTGVYSSISGDQVVLIDKNLDLSGGWSLDFTYQPGYSDIDGGNARQGVIVEHDLRVSLERLNIYLGHVAPGAANPGGGGVHIRYLTKATLTNLLIHDNVAGGILSNVSDGGGIYSEGSVILVNSQVYNNQASDSGGGIYNYEKSLTLSQSQVYSNTANNNGGGIASWGDVVLNDSAVNRNQIITGGMGAGIYMNGHTLTLNRTTVQANTTQYGIGGGIYGNYITLNQSFLGYNQAASGGGLYIIVGEVDLYNSTVMGNHATSNGGGMQLDDALFLINSSILFNQADNDGGGIYAGIVQASNATIAGNIALHAGGGLDSPQVHLRNTILANNQAPTSPDCAQSVGSSGYNLVGNTSGCTFNSSTGDLLNVDPQLIRLFGWPALLPLKAGSPAIDGGNPGGCTDQAGNPITTDQRGNIRPVDGTGSGTAICDIGAYEYDPAHLPQWLFLPWTTR